MCGSRKVRSGAEAETTAVVGGDDRCRSWGMNTSLNASVWAPLGEPGTDAPMPSSTYSITQTVIIGTFAAFLSIITVVGNIMVMISFKIDKQLQTISNYFLFSLAVADFAIGLISMPLFTVSILLGYWPLGPLICDTWLALDYLASNASVLNLLIISFDRYFSVTRPLTYRVKRTTNRAAFMIGMAWGISLLLWPPWIYSWPYIEGERTVPDNQCYIQFIETNHYITFGTAIAAFYVPVTIMCGLYWRIWRETEKRQKDLPNLQAGKKDSSKRSNSSDEANNTCTTLHHELGDDWRRPSCTDGSLGRGSHTGRSYGRGGGPLGVNGVRRWCVQWWHSGREDTSDTEDTPSEFMAQGATTPVSVETPLQSSVSRCISLNVIRDPYISTYGQMTPTRHIGSGGCGGVNTNITSGNCLESRDSRSLPPQTRLRTAISTESVYTILIRLPNEPTSDGTTTGSGGNEVTDLQPSIKMIPESGVNTTIHRRNDPTDFCLTNHLNRRPSQMPDIRIPLNAKIIPKQLAEKSLLAQGGKHVVKKKKKSQEKKADKKAAKTLSAILLTFIITWTPYNILVLIKPLTACASCIPQQLWDFFYYLCYINSTINPMCYALCNASFRRTYLRILQCKWHTRNRTAMNRGHYG